MISPDQKNRWISNRRTFDEHDPDGPLSRRGFLKRLTAGGVVLAAAPYVPYSSLGLGRTMPGGDPSNQGIPLFNGRDLSGWEPFLVDENARMEDVWSVEDGILVCKGEPRGHLHTAEDYESFKLVVEWRWPEEPGNSGVLMRISTRHAAELRGGTAAEWKRRGYVRIPGLQDRRRRGTAFRDLHRVAFGQNRRERKRAR